MNGPRPLYAIGLMVAAMAAFAATDMFLKLATRTVPVAEVILVTSVGGTVFFAALVRAGGQPLVTPLIRSRGILTRNAAEIFGSVCMVHALALAPLSLVVAINQSTPLIATVCAALLLGERVGPRRWLAIAAGFCGVLLILRPENVGITAGVLFSIGAAFGMAIRDVCTRTIPMEATTLQISTWGLAALVPFSMALLAVTGGAVVPDAREATVLAAATISLIVAYYTVTAALRCADVSLVVPYRYFRILFALVIAVTVFGERPGFPTLFGAAIIVGSGLFILRRERQPARLPRARTPRASRRFRI